MHEHIRKRRDLLAVFEQLRQIIGDALRVDRVHFRHFHGNSVGWRRRVRVRSLRNTPLDTPGDVWKTGDGGGVFLFFFDIGCQMIFENIFRVLFVHTICIIDTVTLVLRTCTRTYYNNIMFCQRDGKPCYL